MNIREKVFSTLNVDEIKELLSDKKIHNLFVNEKTLTPYLTYKIIDERYGYGDESGENITAYIVQIDYFVNPNNSNETKIYSKLEDLIKNKMIENGFKKSWTCDLFDEKLKLTRKTMRFKINM